MLARRDLVRLSASALLSALAPELGAEPVGGFEVSLFYEFPKSSLRDISADSTRLCLEDWDVRGYAPIRVVEFGTWTTIYAGALQSRTTNSYFFADGQTLWLEGLPSAKVHFYPQVIVDLRTGRRTERMQSSDVRYEHHLPLADGVLLATRRGVDGDEYRLALVEFPNYRETAQIPYPSWPLPAVSADRKVLAYWSWSDGTLTCRRTEDLGIIWTRPIDTQLKVQQVVLSAHGTHVAVSFADSPEEFKQHQFYVAVYSGETGDEVARLPLSGRVAISPDGRLVAMSVRERSKDTVTATVQVYSVPSRARLASIVHGHDKIRNPTLEGGCEVNFTPDGRFLITSNVTTKLWRIGG